MATIESNPPWEELLQHGRFVRALARTLVRDGAAADDVAQSTWLAVARRPPVAVASLRGWLRRVVTNTALQEQRSATRRDARERSAARGEPEPAADIEAAQLEVQQRLLAAVQALDAKFRSVVVLRFYEGLPPRKIAARLELPIATVRTHLQRAIEQLRDELDARSERGREQWLEALAPLAIATGAPMSAAVLASAAAVVLAASGVWWVMGGGGGSGDSTEPDAAMAALQEALPPGEGAGGEAAATSATRSDGASEVASVRPDVSGRVVDAFGRPIEGAAIEIDDRDATTEPRRATSGADGHFAFDAVGLGNVSLLVSKTDLVGWQRWLSLDPRRPRELGLDVVLLEARTVQGVVVDAAGAPIAGAMLVAWSDSLRGAWTWPEAVSGSDGGFALAGVPTCAMWLTVVAPGFAMRRVGPLEADAPAAPITLVAQEPATLELVALDASGAPLSGATVSVQTLAGDDGRIRHVRLPQALLKLELPADGRLVTAALPRGRYRFQVYSRAHGSRGGEVTAALEAGATTRLELRATSPMAMPRSPEAGAVIPALAASLRGIVVDDGGAPVAAATIELERPGAAAHESAVATATSDFDGTFVLDGLAASSTALRLRVGSGRPRSTKVMEGEITLDAGTRIEGLRLVVPRCATVTGRVVDGAGRPTHGAIVSAKHASEPTITTTARDGTFRLAGLAPGEMRLAVDGLAKFGGVMMVQRLGLRDSLLLTLAPGEARTDVELVDGDPIDERTLHGTIVTEGWLAADDRGRTWLSFASPSGMSLTTIVSDGRFRCDDVPDTSATLAASWLEARDEGSAAPIRMVFGPRVEAAPGLAPVAVPLPAPAASRVHARLVRGDAAPLLVDVVVAAVDGSGSDIGQCSLPFARADGELVIEGLAPGRYQLRLPDDVVRDFEVVGTVPVELGEIELAAAVQVEGVVTDAAGAPIVGARIGCQGFTADSDDGLDAKQPIATTDADGAFAIVRPEFPWLLVVADGFAPMRLMSLPDGRLRLTSPNVRLDDPIVLLPAGDLVLTGFPRDLAGSNAWLTAVLALDPPESRVGYQPGESKMGTIEQSISFHRIPVGLYALCFWKAAEPGVHRLNEPKPTQTVAHEAYRWTVEVKEGLTTTIDLSKEW